MLSVLDRLLEMEPKNILEQISLKMKRPVCRSILSIWTLNKEMVLPSFWTSEERSFTGICPTMTLFSWTDNQHFISLVLWPIDAEYYLKNRLSGCIMPIAILIMPILTVMKWTFISHKATRLSLRHTNSWQLTDNIACQPVVSRWEASSKIQWFQVYSWQAKILSSRKNSTTS